MDQLNKSLLRELVALLQKGDPIAFNKLYDRYRPVLYRFAYRFVRCEEQARELTQLAFVQLWKYRDTIDADKDFHAFLLTITKNLVYKEFQRKAKLAAYQAEISKSEPSYDPIKSFTDYKDYKKLAALAIESLPPQCKKVFKLSRDEGASYEHISNQLNISKNTVHSHMAKSLSHIKAYFKVHTPETILSIIAAVHFF